MEFNGVVIVDKEKVIQAVKEAAHKDHKPRDESYYLNDELFPPDHEMSLKARTENLLPIEEIKVEKFHMYTKEDVDYYGLPECPCCHTSIASRDRPRFLQDPPRWHCPPCERDFYPIQEYQAYVEVTYDKRGWRAGYGITMDDKPVLFIN
jgi:hypothetical protein